MNLIKITLQDGSILIRKGEAFYAIKPNILCVQDDRGRVETIQKVESYSTRVKTRGYVLEVKHKRLGAKLYHSAEVFDKLAQAYSKSTHRAKMWASVPSLIAIRIALKEGLQHPEWSFRYIRLNDPKLLKEHRPTYTEIYEVCSECGGYPTEREGQEIDGGVFEKLPDCDSCANGTKRVPVCEVIEGEDYVLETGKDRDVATCLKTLEVTHGGNAYHVAKFDGVIVTELETKK